jgi:hypothetical protein
VRQPTITPAMYECSLSSQARPEISGACLGSPKVVPHPTQHESAMNFGKMSLKNLFTGVRGIEILRTSH